MLQIQQTLLENVCKLLKEQNLKLVTAESCTGGGLSYCLTSIDGSSDWLERGFVTYSNAAKIESLGVNPDTLEEYGAVSENTALEMACGALAHSHADIAISITGIAGPTGGSPNKPVGTIWIGVAKKNSEACAFPYHLSGDRDTIRRITIEQALLLLKKHLHIPAP